MLNCSQKYIGCILYKCLKLIYLIAQNTSAGTMTHPLYMSVKMATTLIAFMVKKNLIPLFKGASDKYNIITQLFSKKDGIFYVIRSVGMGNDCMLSFTF